MSNKDGIEVMLSLFDDAKRVLLGDCLAEENKVFDYLVEEKKEETAVPQSAVSNLRDYNAEFKNCHKCNNCLGRETVFVGFGSSSPLALFVGDGPALADKSLNKIFSGEEGRELVKWIGAIRLQRSEFYITNIVKCLNTKHLKAFPCSDMIGEEVTLIGPKAVLVLGTFAARQMFKDNRTIDEYRKDDTLSISGVPVTVTYHPRDVLRHPELKKAVWEDLKRYAAQLSLSSRLTKG